ERCARVKADPPVPPFSLYPHALPGYEPPQSGSGPQGRGRGMDPFFARYFPDDGNPSVGYHLAVQAHLRNRVRTVLDLGCRDNRDLSTYRAAGREVWGVDFGHHPHLADPEWFRPLGTEGTIPFPDESFDLVGARWVLEHV